MVVLRRSLTNNGARLRSVADRVAEIALGPEPAPNYEGTGQNGQHQTRLKRNQVQRLVERYREGATTYELAKEFDCHRTTVSEALKREGVRLRRSGLLSHEVVTAIQLYESGLSLVAVGERFGATGDTVASALRKRGVRISASRSASDRAKDLCHSTRSSHHFELVC